MIEDFSKFSSNGLVEKRWNHQRIAPDEWYSWILRLSGNRPSPVTERFEGLCCMEALTARAENFKPETNPAKTLRLLTGIVFKACMANYSRLRCFPKRGGVKKMHVKTESPLKPWRVLSGFLSLAGWENALISKSIEIALLWPKRGLRWGETKALASWMRR